MDSHEDVLGTVSFSTVTTVLDDEVNALLQQTRHGPLGAPLLGESQPLVHVVDIDDEISTAVGRLPMDYEVLLEELKVAVAQLTPEEGGQLEIGANRSDDRRRSHVVRVVHLTRRRAFMPVTVGLGFLG